MKQQWFYVNGLKSERGSVQIVPQQELEREFQLEQFVQLEFYKKK